jgi:hypothetical protein
MGNDTSTSIPTPRQQVLPVPTEDSGLHDLKSMARTTKQRLSSRRATAQPELDDDTLLSSTSAGFKAMALPTPATSVLLPNPGVLPAMTRSPRSTNSEGAFLATALSESSTVAKVAPAVRSSTNKNRMPLMIGAGMTVAAAAATAFVLTRSPTSPMAAAVPSAPIAATKAVVAPTAVAIVQPEPASEPPVRLAATAEPELPSIEVAPLPIKVDKNKTAAKDPGKEPKVAAKALEVKATPVVAAIAAPNIAKPAKSVDDAGSVDDLLKEAGVKIDNGGADKPTLDKKELTRDDIGNAMKARNGAAVACMAKTGVGGTVGVKLSVAPSGQVVKASATGPLAGTPTADCVIAAARGASFPAWDGRPTTVSYSYLLAD